MSGLDFVCTVLMDGKDVTRWVNQVWVSQENSVDRKFKVTFVCWDGFNENGVFDIYGSYDPTDPFQEIMIRNGRVPPDRYRTVELGREKIPHIVAEGYDYVWLAKRKAPRKTIILVPSHRKNEDNINQAIENYERSHNDRPIGRYQVWPGMSRLSSALIRLARAGGLNLKSTIPDYDLAPKVIDPSMSYWHAIENLARPYAPHIYYVRQSNTLVLADRMAEVMHTSNKLVLSANIVNALTAKPSVNSRIRRVIMRVPAWH